MGPSLYLSLHLFIDPSIKWCFNSMAEQPRSQQLPRWVKKFDFVSFGPLSKHSFLSDEAVTSVWSTLVEHILGTFIPATWLIVVVGDLPYAVSPIRKKEINFHFLLSNSLCMLLHESLYSRSLHSWCPDGNHCSLKKCQMLILICVTLQF